MIPEVIMLVILLYLLKKDVEKFKHDKCLEDFLGITLFAAILIWGEFFNHTKELFLNGFAKIFN